MSVVVVATISPIPEYRSEVIAAIEAAIAGVHGEDGCELYALHEGDENLVMIEKWTSPEALQAHIEAPALGVLQKALEGKTNGAIGVDLLQAHPAGTAEQGTL